MPHLTSLIFYPIKSCGGIAVQEARIAESGLSVEGLNDREWMVVDAKGRFLTQRDFPRMAAITPRITAGALEVAMPGMPALQISLTLPSPDSRRTIDVQIWDDHVVADDCGEACADWFSQALKTPCRLVRHRQGTQRHADPAWTGGTEVPALFSDGFPILVISEASLADLNEKLMRQDRSALPMNRFRPNIVIGGVEAFEEDYAAWITLGDAVLKPVKPCPRCPVPSVDQASGEVGPDPLDILRTYRINAKVNGAITFGMNAIVHAGVGALVRVGQPVDLELDF